jgi:transposase
LYFLRGCATTPYMCAIKGYNGLKIDPTTPLTEEQAAAIYILGKEAVIFALLCLSSLLAAKSSPSLETPSGMLPPYQKPRGKRGRKKRGAKHGHPGHTRTRAEITAHTEHEPQECCPDCGTPLGEVVERRRRVIEDIGESAPEITEHSIPRQWCPQCQKLVEPRVEEALAGSTIGHRLVALSAWLHYGLGVTISQVRTVCQTHLHFQVSEGGLIGLWHRVAGILYEWYVQIGDQVKVSGVLHADETGWRVAGQSQWLWCFTTSTATYYLIHRSRGSPALDEFFTEVFDGILITDFWSAYNALQCGGRQACLSHLFRELKKVDANTDTTQWTEFSTRLKRVLHDALRLVIQRNTLDAQQFLRRRVSLDTRLSKLIETEGNDKDVLRLIKRLRRYQDALFTFVDYEHVAPTNNHAEREIRPAVIMRKNSYTNQSQNGADTQAILMSVYRTLKLRGHNPLITIVNALKLYVKTGKVPPLPI